jgi:release factor glutamine methyltransferase
MGNHREEIFKVNAIFFSVVSHLCGKKSFFLPPLPLLCGENSSKVSKISSRSGVKTIEEVLNLSTQFLEEKGIARPRRLVEDLLSHCLKLSRLEIYMQFDRPLVESELQLLRTLVKRSAQFEPLAYLLGEVSFYNCRFLVSPAVLIPRPETEILLDHVVKELKGQDLTSKKAWDLCCGSGCLGIGLKKALSELEVTLSDLSAEALAIAQKNSELNQVEVSFKQGDLLFPFKGEKVDVVMCNPPYISEADFQKLDPHVRLHEPRMALVGGYTGLEFYVRLAKELPAYLNPGAKVFFEIGYDQGERMGEIFNATCWKTKRVEKDWAGKDRFFFLEMQSIYPLS